MRFGGFVFVFLIVLLAFGVSAQSYSSSTATFVNTNVPADFKNYYSSEGRLSTYYPILSNPDSCQARQDILLQVAPAGCQPTVVRSDLLAEQNVPVFCQIDALKINPLLDIKEIRNIRFSGDYPDNVVGVGFHPANAALRTSDQLLGSPSITNIGYAVIVLKKNTNESSLPSAVNFTLNAQLDYFSGNALGVGRSEFLLEQTSDDDWKSERNKNSFLNGNFFVRLLEVDSNVAKVAIYSGDNIISTVNVNRGSQSSEVFLPGSYCQAGLRVQYNGFESVTDIAKIQIDDDVVDVSRGARFLNGKCYVRNLNYNGNNDGSVDLTCGTKSFSLSLSPNFIDIGDVVKKQGSEELFSVTGIDTIKGVYTVRDQNGKEEVLNGSFVIPVSSDKVYEAHYDSETEEYFSKAIADYESVSKGYSNVKNPDATQLEGVSSYGEDALKQAINLANDFDKEITEVRLIEEFLEEYPNSPDVNRYLLRLDRLYSVDASLAGTVLDLDNSFKTIKLLEISRPKQKSVASFFYGSQDFDVSEGESSGIGILNVTLDSVIDENNVRVTAYCNNGENNVFGNSYSLRLGDPGQSVCGGGVLRVNNIEVNKIARISLVPQAKTSGDTNFTVSIGIEKRAIQLSPDKTKERIDNLNKTIQKWQSLSDSLEKPIEDLKAACFATSAALTVKNFFTGLGGEALARQKVMRGPGGWDDRCQELVGQGFYSSLTECFNAKSSEINSDVSAYTKAINTANQKISGIENANTESSGGFFGDKVVDRDTASKILIGDIRSEFGDQTINVDGKEVKVNEIVTEDSYSKGNVRYEQLRDMYANLLLKSGSSGAVSEVGEDNAEKSLGLIGSYVQENQKFRSEFADSQKLVDQGYAKPADNDVLLGRGSVYAPVRDISESPTLTSLFSKSEEVTHSATLPLQDSRSLREFDQSVSGGLNSGTYVVGLSKLGDDSFSVEEVYQIKNGNQVQVSKSEFISEYRISRVITEQNVEYNNRFSPGTAEVKYFESEPYKGMPALVPFDLDTGWYVATKQSLSGFGNIKSFEASGRPVSFWICNIGDNKRPEFFEGIGDDICGRFDLTTGQSLNKFPGLSEGQTTQLVSQAVQALNDAAEQYGSKSIRINNQVFSVGSPTVGISGTQCQDFMSPEDCQLLFNVCDPVICPSSRCDLGGAYPVSDVIQTGVVGSALLCLPNYKQGIVLPVCLTGIKAGIDGYLSILKSHQQCLQENLDTGQTVGICDEISSVYTCEFFWRQVAPVANTLLPKIIQYAYSGGQGRGGGEYLTVQSAWDNAQASVDYMTKNYAQNAFDAFKVRSFEEAGTQVCRAFVSVKAPSQFETLIEPDSPPQFYGWFSEIPFTDATVPASSQYKVFYHIFAGNDRGVSFSVYMKDPPPSSYYASTPTVVVKSGFVGKGEFATETVDFTAPEGYKQLCVRIDDKEECGFSQVTSDFALNYVRDQFVSDEITRQDVTTESECISGGTNLAALLTPNVQEAAQGVIDPANYNKGVVRVCATDNPGRGTEPDRFIGVGYCGDQKITCWLDKESVDNALSSNVPEDAGIKNQTLQELENSQIAQLGGTDNFVADIEKTYSDLRTEKENLLQSSGKPKARNEVNKVIVGDLVDKINQLLSDNLLFDWQKAKLISLRAEIFDDLSRIFKGAVVTIDTPGEYETEINQTQTSQQKNTQNSGSESGTGVNEDILIESISFFVSGTEIDRADLGELISVEIKRNVDSCPNVKAVLSNKNSGPIKEKVLEKDSLNWNIGSLPEGEYNVEVSCFDVSKNSLFGDIVSKKLFVSDGTIGQVVNVS